MAKKKDDAKAKDQQDPNAADTDQPKASAASAEPATDSEGSGTDAETSRRASTTDTPGSDEPLAVDTKDEDETGTTAQGADAAPGEDALNDASKRPLRMAPFTQSLEAQNPGNRQPDHLAAAAKRRREGRTPS